MTEPTVRLRALLTADEGALAELFADPDTGRWNPGPVADDLARWRVGSSELADDFRTWAVTDDTGAFLGLVSVFSIDDTDHSAEIGFRTLPSARGRGLARAGVELACAWAAEQRGVRRIVLFHAIGNAASCRVAAACGFPLESTLPANHRYGDGELHDEHLHVRIVLG